MMRVALDLPRNRKLTALVVRSQNAYHELLLGVQTLAACEPTDVSLLYWCWFLRTANGFAKLDDGAGGGQHYAIAKVGTHGVAARLAKWCQLHAGVKLMLRTAVTRIEQTGMPVRLFC